MSVYKACIECGDKYHGNSWGIESVCFYCYFGEKDRQWKPEWDKEMSK